MIEFKNVSKVYNNGFGSAAEPCLSIMKERICVVSVLPA